MHIAFLRDAKAWDKWRKHFNACSICRSSPNSSGTKGFCDIGRKLYMKWEKLSKISKRVHRQLYPELHLEYKEP